MKKIYIGYDENFYVNQYSDYNPTLTLAYADENLEIEFGYTKVKVEDDKYILYNQNEVNERYLGPSNDELYILELRNYRSILLLAFDKYKSNVNYGITVEDEETKNIIITWYHDLLNLVESAFEDSNIPSQIKYYL